jgi:hypothetical protein
MQKRLSLCVFLLCQSVSSLLSLFLWEKNAFSGAKEIIGRPGESGRSIYLPWPTTGAQDCAIRQRPIDNSFCKPYYPCSLLCWLFAHPPLHNAHFPQNHTFVSCVLGRVMYFCLTLREKNQQLEGMPFFYIVVGVTVAFLKQYQSVQRQ